MSEPFFPTVRSPAYAPVQPAAYAVSGITSEESTGGGSTPEVEEGITLETRPASADVFVDNFTRADSTNGDLGANWTVVDAGSSANPFRILNNNAHAQFPGGTNAHRSAYLSAAGWDAVSEGFIACVSPDVTGADGDVTWAPMWYWNGQDITGITAYMVRRHRTGRDTWLQEVSSGPIFATLDQDLNIAGSTGQQILQAAFAASDQDSAGADYNDGADYSADHRQAATDTSLSAGRIGFFFRVTSTVGGTPVNGISMYMAVKGSGSRTITVSGLPSGWGARVQGAPDTYTASTAGVATILCQNNFVDSTAGYDAIEVVNAGSSVQATFNRTTATDNRILPGTTFSYSS